MSAIVVAKKDFRDAVRSPVLILLTLLFSLLTLGGAAFASLLAEMVEEGGSESTVDLLAALQAPAGFLVPIIALVVGYGAVAGEREDGSLKFLLGLPHRRRDVVLGKVLGRTGVVAASILIGFTVGLGGFVAFVGSVSLVHYVGFTLVTILFGFVYVCIGVALSSLTRSTTRAAIGAICVVVLVKVVWAIVGWILLFSFGDGSAGGSVPDWYLSYLALSPDNAYSTAVGAVLGGRQGLIASTVDTLPLLAKPWFAFVVLAVWALVPLGLGILRFDRVDL